MKHIKVFEKFNDNTIDDILLEFIDNGDCKKITKPSESKYCEIYSFTTDTKNASKRLLDFGIKHQICRNYVIIISDTLLDILSSIFKNINKISQDGDYEYYGSDKFKIFSYDYLSQNVKLTIEIWEIFRKIKLEPSTISTIITWYMQHISSKIKIKVRRVEPRGYTINPKIWITNRSI